MKFYKRKKLYCFYGVYILLIVINIFCVIQAFISQKNLPKKIYNKLLIDENLLSINNYLKLKMI